MEETIERGFDVGADPNLEISNGAGAIHVRGEDTSTIQVQVVKRGSEEEIANTLLEFSQNGKQVVVAARGQSMTCSVEFDVTVPLGCAVQANSTSGEIRIVGIRQGVRANNASGEIVVEDIEGGCTVDSASGSVRIRGLGGALTLRTASGDVEVLDSRLPGFDLNGASGSFVIETPLVASGTYAARTASGSLTLRVPPETGASVILRTMSGGIHSDLPAEVASEGFGRWRGRINGGGALVEMYSASGDLNVERGRSAVVSGTVRTSDTSSSPGPHGAEEPMTSDTTAVLKALERGDLTLDDAMRRLNDL